MALRSRRTMRAFDRPTVGCCPSAPASGRIRGGQSSNWRPLWSWAEFWGRVRTGDLYDRALSSNWRPLWSSAPWRSPHACGVSNAHSHSLVRPGRSVPPWPIATAPLSVRQAAGMRPLTALVRWEAVLALLARALHEAAPVDEVQHVLCDSVTPGRHVVVNCPVQVEGVRLATQEEAHDIELRRGPGQPRLWR